MQAVISEIHHHTRQPSDAENPHVHQCRFLHVLVAVRGRSSDGVLRQIVQAAFSCGIRSDVACKHQQRSQRVHLFVDEHTVPASVRSARVTILLFQTVFSFIQ